MAEILSFSVQQEDIKEITRLQKNYGFGGRSETIRAALSLLAEEDKKLGGVKGISNALIIAIHSEKETGKIMEKVHKEQKAHLVKSQMHHHIDNEKCFELFILKGKGREIESLLRSLKSEKGVHAKLMLV